MQNVWDNFLFDLAESLSFGFVTDVKTALMAAVLLGFIVMGFDILRELLQGMSATSAFDKARKYFNLMQSDENLHGKDSPEYDYHSRVYGVHMNNAVTQSFASGKSAYEPDIIMTDGEVASNSDFISDDGQKNDDDPGPSHDDYSGPSDDDRPGWL